MAARPRAGTPRPAARRTPRPSARRTAAPRTAPPSSVAAPRGKSPSSACRRRRCLRSTAQAVSTERAADSKSGRELPDPPETPIPQDATTMKRPAPSKRSEEKPHTRPCTSPRARSRAPRPPSPRTLLAACHKSRLFSTPRPVRTQTLHLAQHAQKALALPLDGAARSALRVGGENEAVDGHVGMLLLDEEHVPLLATTLKLGVRRRRRPHHAREHEVKERLHLGIQTRLQEETEHVDTPQR